MKEKFLNLLGGFGVVLYYLLIIFIAVLPLVMIDLPFWGNLIAVGVVYWFPPLSLPLWIWGLVKAIQGPQDLFAIIYYIAMAVVYLPTIISIVIGLFKKNY